MKTKTRNVLLIVGAVLLLSLAWYFRSIVAYIFVSAILATMGRPLVRWLKKIKIWKFHINASIGALITLLIMWLVCMGFFWFVVPLVGDEFQDLATIDIDAFVKALEEPVNKVTQFIYGKSFSFSDYTFSDIFGSHVSHFFEMSQLSNVVESIAGLVGNLLIGAFSVTFITFFFLREEGMFKNGLMLLAPHEYEERVWRSLNSISTLLRRYFAGILLEMFMVATLDSIGLGIIGLGIGDAVLIGLICGLFNIIPYLGPWIGAAIGLLIGFALHINADFATVTLPFLCFMGIVFAIVQVLDNILFQPLIYSSSVKAHPMEIFLVILAAGSFAGVLGMILAIPVYTIVRVFAAEFLSNIKIVKKITENLNAPEEKSEGDPCK